MMKVWVAIIILIAAACVSAALWRPAFGASPSPLLAHCGGNVSPPPPPFTPSPERLARARQLMRQRAMHVGMYLHPAKQPYEFVLKANPPGFGPNAAAPPVRRDSIRFALNRTGGPDESGHVHLLRDVPQTDEVRNPCDTTPVFTAGLAIDTRGLQAGMYVLRAGAEVDPMTLPDGDVVTGAKAYLGDWRIYIPALPGAPQKRIGQQFLMLPDASSVYRDASGREIARRDVAMHVATLVHIDGDAIDAAVSGTPYVVHAKIGESIADIDGLVPLVEDATVRDLNTRYAGRSVWGRGGLGTQCVLDSAGGTFAGSGPPDKPYRVKRVFRVYRSYYELAIGAQIGAISGGRTSSFIDESPVVVWLDVPRDARFTAMMGTGAMSISARTASPAPPAVSTPAHLGPSDACVAYFMLYADAWDMDRAYSLVAPPPNLGQMRVGLTREEVTWILGYPSEYAAVPELDRRSAWRYDNLPPFNYWVYFDREGRVVKFGPDGQLP